MLKLKKKIKKEKAKERRSQPVDFLSVKSLRY